MRIAITANGPGEFAGWVRPLVSALLRLAPETEIALFFVPDDYATGRESDVAHRLFPTVRTIAGAEYVRFALGRPTDDAPHTADVVQYLGGDLMHAERVRARLGGVLRTYKFARKGLAKKIDLAYAVDAKNAVDLERARVSAQRVTIVGNLAIDGALAEAAGAFPPSGVDVDVAPGAVLMMPGTRKLELANMVPMYLDAAVRLRAIRPDLRVAFAISPFTTENELARVLAAGGHRNAWASRGRVVPFEGGLGLVSDRGGAPFPVVRDAMRHASRALFAVTLPGTKCIELAALGVPTIVTVPLNAPEVAVINGIFQYVDRLPGGVSLKRAAVIAVEKRFTYTAQPNIDLDEFVMPEMRGTLMTGEIARRIAAYADDAGARAAASERLRALYAGHVGASERMARSLLRMETA